MGFGAGAIGMGAVATGWGYHAVFAAAGFYTLAYAALYGMVQRQAAMLSFTDGFKIVAFVFVVLVPFVFIMKKPAHHGSPGMIAGE
jgi:hypothetical protein